MGGPKDVHADLLALPLVHELGRCTLGLLHGDCCSLCSCLAFPLFFFVNLVLFAHSCLESNVDVATCKSLKSWFMPGFHRNVYEIADCA